MNKYKRINFTQIYYIYPIIFLYLAIYINSYFCELSNVRFIYISFEIFIIERLPSQETISLTVL